MSQTASEDTHQTSLDPKVECLNIDHTPGDDSGEKTICAFYLEGKCRFGDSCFNLHPINVTVADSTSNNESYKKKLDKKCKKKQEEDVLDEKKPPLKTAADVRKRIQWDPDLPKEYFTVGYLDRFSGVVEKPFTAFTWEHISMVDLDQLAVPQHRIQYYKYKDVKVWDKNERLDHVFGSSGNITTIHEVIDEVDAKFANKTETFDPDDESDDDDFVILAGGNDPGGGMIAAACQKAKEDFVRATHFICVKVNNNDLKKYIAMVQEHVVKEEPVLRSCAMPGEILHVTLAMVNFSTPEALLEAGNLLESVKATLEELLTPGGEIDNPQRNIFARGLSTFGSRVLYSPLEVPVAFTTAVHLLNQGLNSIEGAVITNHFEFVPHMTLLKVSRPIARERRSKYINSSLYSDYIADDFGTIAFDNLHLCVIDDMRGPDSFYVTYKNIEF